jgi:hypothetical protein
MEPTTITPLPDNIAALFANTRQATAEEITGLENAATALREDSRFAAECAKALAQEEILRSMEEVGLQSGPRAIQS